MKKKGSSPIELPKDLGSPHQSKEDVQEALQKSGEELEILDGVIAYATRERPFDHRYEELRRFGIAKTVVVRKEDGSRETFRISQTSLVYPNRASGYATLQSNIGRLCTIANVGDEFCSAVWGNYQIEEVRKFVRYEHEYAEDNILNYKLMGIGNLERILCVHNLKSSVLKLQHWLDGTFKSNAPETPEEAVDNTDASHGEIIIDDVDPITTLLPPDDDKTVEPHNPDEEQYKYFGHSNDFYTNRTREQDSVISRSPHGPLIVEGIAGSGKTCTALGRAKVLCDFTSDGGRTHDDENVIFEDDRDSILQSTNLDFFSQDSSIGFVRTGELVQYLKASCLQLNLPNLPISDYQELQNKLRIKRDIEQHTGNKKTDTNWHLSWIISR